MTNKRRLEQVNSLLREEIGEIMLHENTDPVLSALTVTEVRITADLSMARVYVMVRRFNEHGQSQPFTEGDLTGAAERVQKLLAPRIRLKKTPKLHFQVDDTEERAERIESLLNLVREDWEDAERNSEC